MPLNMPQYQSWFVTLVPGTCELCPCEHHVEGWQIKASLPAFRHCYLGPEQCYLLCVAL